MLSNMILRILINECKLWQGSTNLEAIQILKKPGGSLKDSFLDEGYVVPLHAYPCIQLPLLSWLLIT